MKLDHIKSDNLEHVKYSILRVSKYEALELIESLVGQLRRKDPNVKRAEHYLDGSYSTLFTIIIEDLGCTNK